MRAPIKLNRAFWPRVLSAVLPSASDPSVLLDDGLDESTFSDAVSTFKFATTYKTTRKARFPLSLEVLSVLPYSRPPVVLDVGASDGTTSMDIMARVPFDCYFLTDKNLEVFAREEGRRIYFYASDGKCILIRTPAWIVYDDTIGAVPPFGALARSMFARAAPPRGELTRIRLVSPLFKANSALDVRIVEYDIFDRWFQLKPDLIVAANILNRGYFADMQLRHAVGNLLNALGNDGRLAIIDNRGIEKATVFRRTHGVLDVEKRINGGTEIESLVLSCAALAPLEPHVNQPRNQ